MTYTRAYICIHKCVAHVKGGPTTPPCHRQEHATQKRKTRIQNGKDPDATGSRSLVLYVLWPFMSGLGLGYRVSTFTHVPATNVHQHAFPIGNGQGIMEFGSPYCKKS